MILFSNSADPDEYLLALVLDHVRRYTYITVGLGPCTQLYVYYRWSWTMYTVVRILLWKVFNNMEPMMYISAHNSERIICRENNNINRYMINTI